MRGLPHFLLLLCAGLLLSSRPRFAHAQARQPWVATTDTHTAVVHADGTLWSWGMNSNGQLGDGTTTDHLTPAQVGTDSTWQRVAVSSSNTYALKRDGSLWSWGANSSGQLGTGTTGADQCLPGRVGTGLEWGSVTAGEGFALALQRDGSLWAWGTNSDGQLGDGSTSPRPSPGRVVGASSWRHVTAGASHVVAIQQDGTLWLWGYNGQGQLGNGQQTGITHGNAPTAVPHQLGTAHTWVSGAAGAYNSGAVQQDGTVWTWGYGYFLGPGLSSQLTPQPVTLPVPARSVGLGARTTLVVACDGTLWGYGYSYYGELGDGTYSPHDSPARLTAGHTWTQVVMGQQHAVALQPDGSVWAWGANEVGALGHPSLATFAVFAPRQAEPATTWASVSTGDFHTLAVQRDGSLWSWGQNSWGEAGDGTTTPRRLPTQVGTATTWQLVAAGSSHSLALRRDGTLWAWGFNNRGQLGDGTTDSRVTPQQVGAATTWTSVVAGNSHNAALRQDGTLWVWGANEKGQLGLGLGVDQQSLTPQPVGTARWRSVAVGVFHTLAVRADSTLWAWGDNTYGQLGDGTAGGQRATPVQVGQRHDWVSVGAGGRHSLAIRSDGTL
ncbi:RCC1-like domain-containing protein [Hymenobacter psoromatis]|uniref:RCC1-like domain-containing protein n=1 Tax=Hymenobacter psoromatis TaxID=1484116 RepID=UPI001CBCBD64|nr:RCC1 domain-containing protein [Hymenobacter psoromatis]